ncbi:MAG: hypothetical protein JNM68_12990 [Dinghuibacter sp.]|nr:hypothetical protein [Dinghuibacter sp.]
MSVNAKHIATFLLGAAAGFALCKYMNMSDEEKEQFMNNLKNKANNVKDEAEGAVHKAKEYFEELKDKGADALKEHLSDAEKMIKDLFGKGEKAV